MNREAVALLGGLPVRTSPWPRWPNWDRGTEEKLLAALRSGRWSITGPNVGADAFDQRFASAFAAFHGAAHCVPMASGSAALRAALRVLGVGPGDEVLVPGLTWVACASSVADVGAQPVLVDVDPRTLCMSPSKAERAITTRTKAIMIVHLYCTVADIDTFANIRQETGIPLIEDCSHAHGARFAGRRVGTFGDIGVFSMHQSKVLSCGEGGAAITDDDNLYDLLQQCRADGQRYRTKSTKRHLWDHEPVGDIRGTNLALSEFQSAILLDRLEHLEEENQRRTYSVSRFFRKLPPEYASPLRVPPDTRPTYFALCLRLENTFLCGLTASTVANALSSELRASIEPVEIPLNRHPLLSAVFPRVALTGNANDPCLPCSEEAYKTCILLPHNLFLAEETDLTDIAKAFSKVEANREALLEFQKDTEQQEN